MYEKDKERMHVLTSLGLTLCSCSCSGSGSGSGSGSSQSSDHVGNYHIDRECSSHPANQRPATSVRFDSSTDMTELMLQGESRRCLCLMMEVEVGK